MKTYHGIKPGQGAALHLWTSREEQGVPLQILGAGDVPLARIVDDQTRGVTRELTHRIVASVNACEGIEDPATEIPKLRAAAQMAANVDVAFNDGHEAGRAELLEEMGLKDCADPAADMDAVRGALADTVGLLPYVVAVLDGAGKAQSSRTLRDVEIRLRSALGLLARPRCTSTSTGHGHTGTWTDAHNAGPCLTEYTCGGPHGCGRTFTIDSSD